ncbi:hypothetical protein ACLOJK_033173 [Asimina triloba]
MGQLTQTDIQRRGETHCKVYRNPTTSSLLFAAAAAAARGAIRSEYVLTRSIQFGFSISNQPPESRLRPASAFRRAPFPFPFFPAAIARPPPPPAEIDSSQPPSPISFLPRRFSHLVASKAPSHYLSAAIAHHLSSLPVRSSSRHRPSPFLPDTSPCRLQRALISSQADFLPKPKPISSQIDFAVSATTFDPDTPSSAGAGRPNRPGRYAKAAQTTTSTKVYDVTLYVEEHPGGDAILAHAGDDSTEGFYGYVTLDKYTERERERTSNLKHAASYGRPTQDQGENCAAMLVIVLLRFQIWNGDVLLWL